MGSQQGSVQESVGKCTEDVQMTGVNRMENRGNQGRRQGSVGQRKGDQQGKGQWSEGQCTGGSRAENSGQQRRGQGYCSRALSNTHPPIPTLHTFWVHTV